jgi:hypothetical protein
MAEIILPNKDWEYYARGWLGLSQDDPLPRWPMEYYYRSLLGMSVPANPYDTNNNLPEGWYLAQLLGISYDSQKSLEWYWEGLCGLMQKVNSNMPLEYYLMNYEPTPGLFFFQIDSTGQLNINAVDTSMVDQLQFQIDTDESSATFGQLLYNNVLPKTVGPNASGKTATYNSLSRTLNDSTTPFTDTGVVADITVSG